LDYTLDQLEQVLDPSQFFQINRKIITRINAIHKISIYFNSRLKLELQPRTELEVIVIRDRVGGL
jgi:DNA-binding LytR/AlgR family response regulator